MPNNVEKSNGYTVIRSKRRTAAIEITPLGEVLVRVPHRFPETAVKDFVSKHQAWIDKHLERIQSQPPMPEPTPEQRAYLIDIAREELPKRVAYYSRLMGLTPASVKITSARKRFGSCSTANRLCFSWRLMQYPPEAIDYVVVHELAHIRFHHHQEAFYRLIEQYLPDYREREKLLRSR